MKEVVGVFLFIATVVSAMIGMAFGADFAYKNRCVKYGEFYEVPTRYNPRIGCEIQLSDGRWLPLSY